MCWWQSHQLLPDGSSECANPALLATQAMELEKLAEAPMDVNFCIFYNNIGFPNFFLNNNIIIIF